MIEHLREDVASAEEELIEARQRLHDAEIEAERTVREATERLVFVEKMLERNLEMLQLAEEALEKARARR